MMVQNQQEEILETSDPFRGLYLVKKKEEQNFKRKLTAWIWSEEDRDY